jgi:hypothetical protein
VWKDEGLLIGLAADEALLKNCLPTQTGDMQCGVLLAGLEENRVRGVVTNFLYF